MELALAAFTMASSAATAVGGASGIMSIMSGVATAGSVLAGMNAANQTRTAGLLEQQELSFQSGLLSLSDDQEALASQQRAIALRTEALQKTAAARVAFAGAGAGMGPQLDSIEDYLGSELDFGLAIEKTNRKIGALETGLNKSQLSLRGGNAVKVAAAKADGMRLGSLIEGAQGVISIAKRG